LLQKIIASKAIKTITKTSVVEITIIKKRIEKNLNSKKIKTSSNLTRIKTKIATTKNKKLLKQ